MEGNKEKADCEKEIMIDESDEQQTSQIIELEILTERQLNLEGEQNAINLSLSNPILEYYQCIDDIGEKTLKGFKIMHDLVKINLKDLENVQINEEHQHHIVEFFKDLVQSIKDYYLPQRNTVSFFIGLELRKYEQCPIWELYVLTLFIFINSEKNCQDILHILLAILFTYRLITKGTIDYKEFSEHLNEFVNQNKKFLSDQDINIFGELLDYWIGLCKKTFTQE